MIHILKASDGRFYFVIKGINGRVLATSQMYDDRRGAHRGANATVKTFDVGAVIEDKS